MNGRVVLSLLRMNTNRLISMAYKNTIFHRSFLLHFIFQCPVCKLCLYIPAEIIFIVPLYLYCMHVVYDVHNVYLVGAHLFWQVRANTLLIVIIKGSAHVALCEHKLTLRVRITGAETVSP